jgi:hypothetical protein
VGSPLLDETRAILNTCMTLYMLVLVSVPLMKKIWDDCLPSSGAGVRFIAKRIELSHVQALYFWQHALWVIAGRLRAHG